MRRRIARRLRRLAALLDPPAEQRFWTGATTTTNGANITYTFKEV